jgi:hypothetical protein
MKVENWDLRSESLEVEGHQNCVFRPDQNPFAPGEFNLPRP